MKKIINVIFLCVFVSALFSNYSSAHDLPKSTISNQHLKLVSSFMKGKIKDDLFDNFHKAIEEVSGKSGWELVREIEDVYEGLKNACKELKDVEFKKENIGKEIKLEIRIKAKNKIYKNQIIVEKEAGIIWDKIDDEIKELCENLKAEKNPYLYLSLIKDSVHEYYDNEDLDYKDRETLFLVLETIATQIDTFKNKKRFSWEQEDLFLEYLNV
ncbi:hypothetical protein ACFL5N_02140, partial [bacterium]